MQHEISFIDFVHVSSLFLRNKNRILSLKSAIQQKKLSNLVKSSISRHDPSQVIFSFSKCVYFFYRNICNLSILSNEDLDFLKTRTKEAALSFHRNYNNNVPQHLSKEEILVLQNLRKNKNVVIQKSDKGNSAAVVHKADYLDKMDNLLNDTRKFENINLKSDGILNFVIN